MHYNHSHKNKGFIKKKDGLKREPCEGGCNFIIKFSHCLNFGYHKYGIIIFLIRTQNGCTRHTQDVKNL